MGYDIRKGVWVCIEAAHDYIKRCFQEYQVVTDPGGRNMVLYKKWHLIGLELGVSVASVGIRKEATGVATCFNADAVATAKRPLKPGEMLDGEGGYTVYGKLVPAAKSLQRGLPAFRPRASLEVKARRCTGSTADLGRRGRRRHGGGISAAPRNGKDDCGGIAQIEEKARLETLHPKTKK